MAETDGSFLDEFRYNGASYLYSNSESRFSFALKSIAMDRYGDYMVVCSSNGVDWVIEVYQYSSSTSSSIIITQSISGCSCTSIAVSNNIFAVGCL